MIRSAPTSLIALDPTVTGPVYQQIVARLRGAIANGTLAPGARLPATRVLATQLGVARGTVETAYALLAGEGMIETRGAAGTVVALALGQRIAAPRRRITAPQIVTLPTPEQPKPFRLGLPALDAFPRTLWARLAVRETRAVRPVDLAYPAPAGHPALREAIALYLGLSRGIVCDPAQVLITGGYQGALGLITRSLLRDNDAVWVEDPCYHMTREGLRTARARLVPVPVDAEGLRVERGIAMAPSARLAVVTPTHQSPLGVALSLKRRLALLDWAATHDAWIIEDDYDGEFHYTGHPLPALKSLDRSDRVLYVGSFSKVLFPGLRLGYVVVPSRLMDRLGAASLVLQSGQSDVVQRTVAAFMREGHFARHLRRMRALYGKRRATLGAALQDAFGDKVSIALQNGGMHLLARFALGLPDAELEARAIQVGLAPTALSRLYLRRRSDQALALSFTNVAEENAPALVRRLATALLG